MQKKINKYVVALLVCFCYITLSSSFAQEVVYDTINIEFNKTTVIKTKGIKPTYDVGTSEVLQSLSDDKTILKLTAVSNVPFDNSSLFLETEDGLTIVATLMNNHPSKKKFYNYQRKNTAVTSEKAVDKEVKTRKVVQSKVIEIEKGEDSMIENIMVNAHDNCNHGVIDHVSIVIDNISIIEDYIYFRIYFLNKHEVDYPIDMISFSVQSKKGMKRQNLQTRHLIPDKVLGGIEILKGAESSTMIFGFKSFSISDQERFIISLREERGGRQTNLKLSQKDLLKAKKIYL